MKNPIMFPIMHDPIIRALPWAAFAPHEAQAMANHGQSLKVLANRGGLSICEAYAIFRNQPWRQASGGQKHGMRIWLLRHVKEVMEHEESALAGEVKS